MVRPVGAVRALVLLLWTVVAAVPVALLAQFGGGVPDDDPRKRRDESSSSCGDLSGCGDVGSCSLPGCGGSGGSGGSGSGGSGGGSGGSDSSGCGGDGCGDGCDGCGGHVVPPAGRGPGGGLPLPPTLLVSRSTPTLPGRLGIAAIRGYRRWVSPRLATRCRYTPTCSRYGTEAIRRYGLAIGVRLAYERVHSCTHAVPYGTCDPVPAPAR